MPSSCIEIRQSERAGKPASSRLRKEIAGGNLSWIMQGISTAGCDSTTPWEPAKREADKTDGAFCHRQGRGPLARAVAYSVPAARQTSMLNATVAVLLLW